MGEKANGLYKIKEYTPGELFLYRQGQNVKYPCSDINISKFNALDFRTFLTEDEVDFIYSRSMEITNTIKTSQSFGYNICGYFFHDVESEETELVEN